MATLRKYILICFGIFQLYCGVGKAQDFPSVPCPDIFQYKIHDDTNIGMVTLNNLPLENTVVGVKFSQREPLPSSYRGHLSLMDDLKKTKSNLQRGQPITYRVDFPTPNEIPKLKEIKVNGKIICTGPEYPAPSKTFSLRHTFFPYGRHKENNNTGGSDNVRALELTSTRPEVSQIDPSPPMTASKFSQNPFIRQYLGQKSKEEIPLSYSQQIYPSPQRHTQITDILPLSYSPEIYPSAQRPITQQPVISNPSPALRGPNSWSDFGCGREGFTPFVVDGNDFPRGKFPWLVATYVRVAADLKFRCGGSLISSRTVITAAHCFPPSTFAVDQIFIVLGRHNLYISEDGSEQRDVASISVNPSYNTSRIADADIALLHMKSPVSFSEYIRPICLWSELTDPSLIVDTEAFVAGWGGDNNGNRVTATAKMVVQKIVSESECLRSSDLFSIITSSRSLCAGSGNGSGPCMGDSGGGLMIYKSGIWTLRGVLSVGGTVNNKCDLNQYIVYCDVAPHMTWIRQNMLT